MFMWTALGLVVLAAAVPAAAQAAWPNQSEGDFVLKDFAFESGEKLDELKQHYTTIGTPHRNAAGEIDNAVLLLHGTSGTGKNWLMPSLADELFAAGQPLDASKYFIVMPDGIGRGGSSKPSDGLRAKFPHYRYTDIINAQHRLLTEHLGIKHLRLVLGSSMAACIAGCGAGCILASWMDWCRSPASRSPSRAATGSPVASPSRRSATTPTTTAATTRPNRRTISAPRRSPR
jgi:hypothetical protein